MKENEIKEIWDTSSPDQRLEIINNQMNEWLPIHFGFEFIYQVFDKLPEPVRNWLVKYYNK